MKTRIITLGIVSLMSAMSYAQSPAVTPETTPVPGSAATATEAEGAQQQDKFIKASRIKDQEIQNQQGESLGKVDEMIIDTVSGKIRYVVVNVDQAAAAGQTGATTATGGETAAAQAQGKRVAVPWEAFEVTREGEDSKLTLQADRQRIANAPEFDETKINDLYSRQTAEPVFTYWAITWVDPMEEPVAEGPGATPSPSPAASPAVTPEPSPGS